MFLLTHPPVCSSTLNVDANAFMKLLNWAEVKNILFAMDDASTSTARVYFCKMRVSGQQSGTMHNIDYIKYSYIN